MLSQSPTKEAMVERVRALAPKFSARAETAEKGRRLPIESAREMLDAGIARILMPKRFGGYDLDFETWYDVVLEISRADCSHGWCASLLIHHPHLIAQYPEECQQAIWKNGPDVPIAASFAPRTQAVRAPGGYRLTGDNASFSSGVDHCTWVMIGAMAPGEGAPQWGLFMVPPGGYSVRDTWHTAGMCGTGSKTIVTNDVFVPETRVLWLPDLRMGKGPGGALHDNPIFRMPFFFYAPLCFAAPMLGAAQGAYAQFRERAKGRKAVDGSPVAEKVSVQVGMARAAADLDAAELLLRRTTRVKPESEAAVPALLARSIRDFARVSEMSVGAMDTLMALSGSAGFASSEPIQRTWRDLHFAASHIGVNPEINLGHFGRTELGLPRDPHRPFF